MFKSIFNSFLLIACLWQYVAVVQCRRQSELSGQQRQHITTCLRDCDLSFQEDGIKATSNVKLSSRQSCYDDCLGRNGNQSPVVNQRIRLFSKRIKRDALNSQTTTPSNECHECSNCPNDTDVQYLQEYVIFNVLETGRYYANISWVPLSDNTMHMNHTGYRLDYQLIGEFNYTTMESNVIGNCILLGKNVSYYIFKNKPDGLKYDSQFNVRVSTIPYKMKENEPDYHQYRVWPTIKTTIKTTKKTTEPDNQSETKAAIIAAIVAALVIVVAALVFLYYHRSRRPKSTERLPVISDPYKDIEFEYDAFIIYSTLDEDWVVETLLPALEEKHGFKCCVHYRNFTIGEPYRDNMVKSVYKSRKTIAVVSTNFCNSNFCGSELDLALHRLIERKDNSLLVIKLDDVDTDKLPIELKQRSYIDYQKSIEKQIWEKKLVKCLKVASLPPHSQSSYL